jgi:hypothetical protein
MPRGSGPRLRRQVSELEQEREILKGDVLYEETDRLDSVPADRRRKSQRQSVFRLSRTLGVARCASYDRQRQSQPDRTLADWLLTVRIEELNRQRGAPSTTSAPPSSTGSIPGTTAAACTPSLGYLSPLEYESQDYDGHVIAIPEYEL